MHFVYVVVRVSALVQPALMQQLPFGFGFYTARDPLLRDPSVGLGQSKVVARTSLLLLLEKGRVPREFQVWVNP